MLTDLEIIKEQIGDGDLKAYEILFKQLYLPLVRFSQSLVHEKIIAEEIAADVLLSVWTNRQRISAVENLRTYLFIAVKNNSLKHLARTRRFVRLEDCNPVAQFQNPEGQLLSGELYRQIQDAIQQLPPRCKMCFQLVKEEGLSYKEAAAVLDISVKTVDAQIVIALKKLAERLDSLRR